MNKDKIEFKLGKRNRHVNGERVYPTPPMFAIDGTPSHHSFVVKGIGRYYFVVLPNPTYRVTEDDLKPFRDYAKKNPPKDGIAPETPKATPKPETTPKPKAD